MKYIAIKLKITNLSDGSILFDPVSVIKGVYNKESDIFVDDRGNKYQSISNSHPESKFCFFEPVSIASLRKKVGNLMSIDELICEYHYDYIGSIFIGMYDNTKDKVNYIEIYLDKIAEHLCHGAPLCEEEYVDYLGYSKEKNTYNKTEELFNLTWSTPYSVLNIPEKQYTKAQLLKIVKTKIAKINLLNISDEKKQEQIKYILDSYNEIIKENESKTKKLH